MARKKTLKHEDEERSLAKYAKNAKKTFLPAIGLPWRPLRLGEKKKTLKHEDEKRSLAKNAKNAKKTFLPAIGLLGGLCALVRK